jgi:hypothetical protein
MKVIYGRGVTLPLERLASVHENRRFGPDRRKHSFWQALYCRRRRRKNTGRRDEDTIGYVDFYDRKTWLVAISLLALSILDALFTAREVASGIAKEANPIMNLMLTKGGIYTFFGVKAAMTTLPLGLLVLHQEWRLARITVRICLGCYALIFLYHLYLLFGCSV